MRSAALLFLLLACAPAVGQELDQLVEMLQHDDPGVRAAARTELKRRGGAAVRHIVAYTRDEDAEVRRFVHRFLARELRAGDPALRREIVAALAANGKDALGFVPDLESIAVRYPGDLGYLARLASMRIAGTRQHVRFLALHEDAYERLVAFDPERAPVLRATARHIAARSPARARLQEYLGLLAAAKPGAGAFLAERVAETGGAELLTWLDIAGRLTRWPRELGAVFAKRIATESTARFVNEICNALLRGPADWAPIREPLRPAVVARIARARPYSRPHLVLVAARCGAVDLVGGEARRNDAAGFAARCALRHRGKAGPDPVATMRALPADERATVLGRLVLSGAPECAPLFLDRLEHGERAERRIILASAEAMPCARALLPGLARMLDLGGVEEIGRALAALAVIDPRLTWAGAEPAVLRGLRHAKDAVREKAVYACDDLTRLTPGIVAAFEKLTGDRSCATALAWTLPNSKRLGERGLLLVPLFARIVVMGPPPALLWGGKSAVRWRRECLVALAAIRPSHAEARRAFRAAIASADGHTRLLALLGFRRVEAPSVEDYTSVSRAAKSTDERVRRAALMVLMTPAWQAAAKEKR